MVVRVAINGYGRIGRLTHRAMVESGRTDIEVVAINDLGKPIDNARLLKYDSVHGRFKGEVSADDNSLTVNGHKIQVFAEKDPANLPWKDLNIDVVMECTGIFTSKEKAMVHINAGAKQVLVSAPAKEADKTIVFGVNSNTLDGSERVVSNASCTTNCLAPVAYVLQKVCGIKKGYMTTIHSYTGDQRTLDIVHPKDPYRGRAAALNMIPTSTGAAKAVGLVLPELAGKLDGSAVRVPTPDVSLVDLTFIPERATTVEAINSAMKAAAEGELKGILEYNDEPLVSQDFVTDSNTSIFDAGQTKIVDGDFVRIVSWYDNEWGFSNKMSDTAVAMAKSYKA
ncbi:MAG: type I glyceraldehyde-3-phosphate dehydrogenase [Alphaproteobacteria bacterium]|nr:type I glyceraldehyde-3-phosphate dehydrogenase [Alphaproteobacteria bacterium]